MTFFDVFDKFVAAIVAIPAKGTTEPWFLSALGAHVSLQIPFCVVRFQTVGTAKRVRLVRLFSGRGFFNGHLLLQAGSVLIGLVRVNYLNGPTGHRVIFQFGE